MAFESSHLNPQSEDPIVKGFPTAVAQAPRITGYLGWMIFEVLWTNLTSHAQMVQKVLVLGKVQSVLHFDDFHSSWHLAIVNWREFCQVLDDLFANFSAVGAWSSSLAIEVLEEVA